MIKTLTPFQVRKRKEKGGGSVADHFKISDNVVNESRKIHASEEG